VPNGIIESKNTVADFFTDQFKNTTHKTNNRASKTNNTPWAIPTILTKIGSESKYFTGMATNNKIK
jgi:hypothetical protein